MPPEKKKQENPMISLLVNVVVPVVVLTVFSKEKFLGPLWGMVAALILPIGYGLYTLVKERRFEMISVLGTVGVLLTGVFGIMKLPPAWIAWKEAAIPFIFGLAIVISLKTPYPLIKKLLMTEALFDVKLLKERLHERGNEAIFEKRLVWLTWGLASSMFLSSILNYTLATMMLKSEPGSEAFAAELGKMTGISYIVILIPSMTIMILVFNALVKTLTSLTGLKFDDILADAHKEKPLAEEPAID